MAINITEIKNIGSLNEAFTWVNTASNNILFNLIMLAIFFIVFFLNARYGMLQAFTLSSFACLALSLLFGALGFVSMTFIIFFLMGTILGGFFMYLNRNME